MTTDHLRPLLESTKDTHLLFTVAEGLSRGRIPGFWRLLDLTPTPPEKRSILAPIFR